MAKIKGIEITFGEGETYTVPPLSLGSVEDLQDRLGAYNPNGAMDVSLVVDCLTASLKRNYPDMTRERVRDMVGLENMVQVMEAVMNVSGLVKKAGDVSGEVTAP